MAWMGAAIGHDFTLESDPRVQAQLAIYCISCIGVMHERHRTDN